MTTPRGAHRLPGEVSREPLPGSVPGPLPAPSISSLALDCDSVLTSLHEMVPLSSYLKLENSITDEVARYKIWAANIGALRDAKSAGSLDSRLKNSSRIRLYVTSGLERLQNAVDRASEIVAGIKPNRTTDSLLSDDQITKLTTQLINEHELERTQNGTTELAELFFNIRSCIANLFTLSTLIRQDRPRGRLQCQSPLLHTQNDAGPDITNVKDKFPKLRQRPWLAERIGKRISQQRDYIRYRQVHRQKLAKRKLTDPVTQDGGSGILSNNATTKATTFVEQLAVIDETSEVAGETFTDGSIHTEATSFATTAFGDDGPGRGIPSLTSMWLDGVHLDYDKHIECPYCRTIQIITDRSDWKRHVYHDLQTYSCTFEHCSSEPFRTSHEWFKHELNCHRRQWKCIWCSTRCDSASALETHFASQHPKTVSVGQIKVMVEACEKAIIHFDDTACPLCNGWKTASTTDNNSSKFRSHLANHLQELAREALPLAIDGLDIREHEEADRENREEEGEFESISTGDSNASHGAPTLVFMVPYGKFSKAERQWRCLVNGSSGLCQTRSSGLEDLERHAKAAHPEIKAAMHVCHNACPECGKILAATECDDCINPPDSEVWMYAASRDLKDPISFEADFKQRSMLNLEIAGEIRRNVWRNSFMTGIPARREEGMDQDPFMNAYLVREGGHPSFQPSDSDYVREEVSVIKFTDILDRTFHFPLSMCLDYPTMIDMVKMAFLYEDFAQMVIAGSFELLNSESDVISPVVWSRVVGPGSMVKMRLLETPVSAKTGYSDAAEEPGPLENQPILNERPEDNVTFGMVKKQEPDAQSVRSFSTAPSGLTALSSVQAKLNRVSPISSPRKLGCEFNTWTNCQVSFDLEEVDQWIRHAEDEHLRRKYPSTCICWFCDDFEFRAEQSLDAGMNFEHRMRHIADHILDGCHFENRRPDFHFLDHVYDMGLISSEAFALAKGQSEGAPAPAGVSSSGFRPTRRSSSEPVVEVIETSRRRQRNRLRYL
ncbi:hypothetical protein GCG54_00009399 [Colletotrichum gloeosporioides]|uniref:C2H2-type domain-containing protein n=1 Tax=Colletotrichum gloeosporioides TaxID=474922 RepID=A0A8H4C4J3_COLGL|nr:uncharacterized protein GCG54_00009399 [Colletotrichum gloeosporioides]KAF3797426.1 hypothetical protein GCG54_00009399 [Colletotrichum gloeosporioides]